MSAAEELKAVAHLPVRSILIELNRVVVELLHHPTRQVTLDRSRVRLLPAGDNHEVMLQYAPSGQERWPALQRHQGSLVCISGPRAQ